MSFGPCRTVCRRRRGHGSGASGPQGRPDRCRFPCSHRCRNHPDCDGKIEAVGKDLAIPSDYRVIDATGQGDSAWFHRAQLARHGPGQQRNDNVPFLSVVDALDPGQEYFEDCLRNGVTTVAIVPGNDTMIGGQAAVIKTAGGFVDQMIVKRQAGIKISLKPTANRSRMSHIVSLRKEFDAARDSIRELANRPSTATPARSTPAQRADEAPPGTDVPGSPVDQQQPEPATGAGQEGGAESPVDVSVRREALVRLLKGECSVHLLRCRDGCAACP